jgi:DNA repair exonuclease SbcCD ATPase subunit
MANEIQTLRNRFEQAKGEKQQIQKSLEIVLSELNDKKRSLVRHEQAREIVREVGLKTQQQLQFHISDITSLALEAVFDDPYNLKVDFIQRRNKTECDLLFVRDGNEIDPITASGVGAIDVAAFALRIASWSMMIPHTRNTIILDEPFKHLKGENANHRVLDMINEISKKMNIQIIMISDERISREDIIASANKVFEVKLRKGVSGIVSFPARLR